MKIKNLFLSMFAMTGILFATSCSQDELINEQPSTGEFVNATFTINTADGMGTRSNAEPIIGKGLTVDKVACAVYETSGTHLSELDKIVPITNQKATFETRLAKGQNYRVAFFAYNEAANAYDVKDLKNIVVKPGQLSNVEGRDAFTAYHNVETSATMNAINETVTLRRPFAQLNLGIDDAELTAAANAGIEIKKSKIIVSNVYSAFNAFENKVVEGKVVDEMIFELNDIPNEKLKVTIDHEELYYNYLALNYLLVGDLTSEKTLTNVKFTWKTDDGKKNDPITEFFNIPVQRNYRTNIIGKLLTSPATFNIVINSTFMKPDYNINRVFNAEDLQAAIDAAPAGKTTTIYLGNNIVGDIIDFQKNDRHIIIDGSDCSNIEGQNYKYDGTIKIHNGSSESNNGSITIKNIDFETNRIYFDEDGKPFFNFIMPNEFGVENGITRRYSQNVTVESCTFTATGDAINNAVGVQANSCTNLQVLNCTATNMHSLLQAQSCGGDVIVKNATINNGKNGVAFKQVKNAVVEGSTIAVAAYGIRFDGNINNYGITIKNNEVTASQPFIVRKMTGANNTIALEEENTLTVPTTEAPAYQIIITNGSDDEAYVKPTGTYTLTGADNYLIFPEPYPIASWDEFTAALAAGETDLKLIANISNATSYSIMKDVILDLNGKVLEISSATEKLNIGNKNDGTAYKPSVTIKNGCLKCKVYAQTGNVTLTDIKFEGLMAYASDAQGVITVGSTASLLAESCNMAEVEAISKSDADKPRALSSEERSSGYLRLIDCNFPSDGENKNNTKLRRTYITPLSGNATLEITNCKFSVAANIDLAASYVWSNMNLTNCSGGFTFTVSRDKNSLTEDETAIMKAIKKNNRGTIKAYYNGTLVTYY